MAQSSYLVRNTFLPTAWSQANDRASAFVKRNSIFTWILVCDQRRITQWHLKNLKRSYFEIKTWLLCTDGSDGRRFFSSYDAHLPRDAHADLRVPVIKQICQTWCMVKLWELKHLSARSEKEQIILTLETQPDDLELPIRNLSLYDA